MKKKNWRKINIFKKYENIYSIFFLKNNVPEDSPKGCSMDVAAGRDTRTPP